MSDPVGPEPIRPPPAAALGPDALRELLSRLAYLQQQGSDDELGYYLHGIERRPMPRRALLYRQGDKVERVYLLISGRVEEVRTRADLPVSTVTPAAQQELLLREAGPGTLLGLYDLVYRQPHSTFARVLEDAEVIVIEAAQVNRLLYRYPELRASMIPGKTISRLRTMPILARAEAVAVSYLAESAELRTYDAGATIYQAGDPADRIYLIHEGQVQLEMLDGRRQWLGNGGDFGYNERAGAAPGERYDLDHNATALSPVSLFVAPRRLLFAVAGVSPEREGARLRALRAETLERIGVFGAWNPDDRARLLGFMSHYHIPTNHLLTQQGEVADSLWVLLPGSRALVHALNPAGEALPEARLEGPGFFNEGALREQALATGTLEAEPGSSWLRLHWQDFRAFLEQMGRPELATQLRLARRPQVADAKTRRRTYPWLEHGEGIVLEARRHWIAAFSKLSPALVSSILLGWLLLAFYVYGLEGRLWTWLAVVLAVVATFSWVLGITDYINDYLIITNLRVVRQEKVILVKESRQMAPLEKVAEVTFRQGLWGNYLGYADLVIQTPGPAGNISFDRVAQFESVAARIKQQRDQRKRHYEATGKKEIYTALENRFGIELELPSRVWKQHTAAPAPAPQAGALQWLARLTGAATGGNPLQRKRTVGAAPAPGAGERFVWHKHWLILLRNTFPPAFLVVGFAALAFFFWWTRSAGAYTNPAVAVPVWLAVMAAGWVWWQVEDWRNDVYILERDQLIDIERRPLGLETQQRSAQLNQIVDIQMRVPTPLHYILNFGSVIVQTAAEGAFTFDNVPAPHEVVETIRRRMDQTRQAEERRQAIQRAQEFPDWLEVYSRLDPNRER